MGERAEYDVVIVGAGVIGGLLASKLAGSGTRVLLVEAGPRDDDRFAMLERYVRAPRKSMGAPYRTDEGTAHAPSPDGPDDYYDHAGSPDRFKATYQRLAGGSTWHWRGNAPRHVPNDFRLNAVFGVGIDWPLTYDELEPLYCEAERELGVAGDHQEWNGYLGAARSAPYPMPKVWPTYGDLRFTERLGAFELDGCAVRVMSTPQARNTQPYDGRPVCTGNSTCDPICPIGAKYDGTVHVKRALARGAALWDRCVVDRIFTEPNGSVRRVRCKRWSGEVVEVFGRVVIVAAHAIETAKLLLLSELANSSDQVGRNLMDHLQGQVAALFPEPLFPFRGPPTVSGIDVFRDGEARRSRAAFRMSVGNDGWGLIEGPYGSLLNAVRNERLFGARLRRRLEDLLPRQFRLSYSTEVLPDPDNRVTLSSRTDGLGIPRPKITFKVSDYNRRAFAYAQGVINRIFDAVGATDRRSTGTGYSSANHIMGTARMGTDPSTSVVDLHGRSHDHRNLFVVGPSMFPTCGTANPTLTAVALALRAVPEIRRELDMGGAAS